MPPKLPKSLQTLLDKLRLAIRDLMDSYAEGDVTAIKWRDTMKALLTRFITASFMSGQKSPLIGVTEQGFIYEYVKAQLGFIDNFYLSIVSSPEFQEGWRARAESYTNSLVAPFWKGETKYLALPAMPGDMTTPCGQLCACLWDIQPIDEEAGDYDCYWRLNAARMIETEHCQICEQRSKEWNPLQIRGGELIIPQGEAGKEYIEHIKEHLQIALKGGEGSGNFGHAGRPGLVGGSAEGGGDFQSTKDEIQGLVNKGEFTKNINDYIGVKDGHVYRFVTKEDFDNALSMGYLSPGRSFDNGGTVNFSKEPIPVYGGGAFLEAGLLVEVPESSFSDYKIYHGSKDLYLASNTRVPLSSISRAWGFQFGSPRGIQVANITNIVKGISHAS